MRNRSGSARMRKIREQRLGSGSFMREPVGRGVSFSSLYGARCGDDADRNALKADVAPSCRSWQLDCWNFIEFLGFNREANPRFLGVAKLSFQTIKGFRFKR